MMWWNNGGSWGSGWSWPATLAIGLGMLACVAMMAMMMRHGMSGHSQHTTDTAEESPVSILAKRLASGEIDVEEYERRRDALTRTSSSPDLRSPDSGSPAGLSGGSLPGQFKPKA